MSEAAPQVVRLLTCIKRFCAEPARAGGPELAADLAELRRGIDLIELKFSELAAAFAGTEEYDEQGSISPIHWIRHNCRMGGGAAADRVAVGEQLPSLGASAEALAGGEIGFAHLALIARTASGLAESDKAKPFDETHLLGKAREFSSGGSARSAITYATPPTPRATPLRRREAARPVH
jgi:hypothetical protein